MLNPRFLKTAERWKNPKVPKQRERSSSQKSLTQILEKDENGKPKLDLTPIEKTAVNPPTQGDYWDLMRVYELGGWVWRNEDLPIQHNTWERYEEQTCIEAGVDYFSDGTYDEGKFGLSERGFFLERNWNVISTLEFYEIQKITPEMLKEINEWFDGHGK